MSSIDARGARGQMLDLDSVCCAIFTREKRLVVCPGSAALYTSARWPLLVFPQSFLPGAPCPVM